MVLRHPQREVTPEVPENPVRIDKGLKQRMVLSDHSSVAARSEPDEVTKAALRAKRRFSRAKKGSNNRRRCGRAYAKICRREQERATQADFRLAHDLVTKFDGIAVEDLNVVGILRSRRFSKKVSAQRWSSFDRILEYQAEKAGVPFVKVPPSNTSTDCSVCGHRQPMPL